MESGVRVGRREREALQGNEARDGDGGWGSWGFLHPQRGLGHADPKSVLPYVRDLRPVNLFAPSLLPPGPTPPQLADNAGETWCPGLDSNQHGLATARP